MIKDIVGKMLKEGGLVFIKEVSKNAAQETVTYIRKKVKRNKKKKEEQEPE